MAAESTATMLTALEGEDGASAECYHIIWTGETGGLPGARLIMTHITRRTQLPSCAVV